MTTTPALHHTPWQQVEQRLRTQTHLYYLGAMLCIDNTNKPGGIALKLDGKGFIYSNHPHLKNSTLYTPPHIQTLVQDIYKQTKKRKK